MELVSVRVNTMLPSPHYQENAANCVRPYLSKMKTLLVVLCIAMPFLTKAMTRRNAPPVVLHSIFDAPKPAAWAEQPTVLFVQSEQYRPYKITEFGQRRTMFCFSSGFAVSAIISFALAKRLYNGGGDGGGFVAFGACCVLGSVAYLIGALTGAGTHPGEPPINIEKPAAPETQK